MRLGGRLAAAIEVLGDIESRHRPAADALKDWGQSHRFAGSGDRAVIGNIVYDALRRKRSAAWLFDSNEPRALAIGALMLQWGMSADEVNATLDGDRFAPEPLSAAELSAIASRNLADAPAAVQADCPDWCAPLAEEAFGDEWISELQALSGRPPLDLRVNTLHSSREQVLEALADAGAAPADYPPDAVRIPPIDGDGRHPNVQASDAFKEGWFEVQDVGSQMVAAMAGVTQGMQVLDYCAGAGGKTLALSAAMKNTGQIFAHDAERQRLNPIFERLRRAGCRNVQAVAGEEGLRPLEGQMDLVLVDAPCTGSGTWRRRPDAKWRLTEKQLETRVGEQTAILEDVKRFRKPGGRIVYITCSFLPQENSHRIAGFIEANPEFEVISPEKLWQDTFGASLDRARFGTHGVTLSPARTATDGFFFSALQRKA
ncbi:MULTISPECIES: RsmB/NOP family class I SAM-dependent RNA methyltransferase [unclassified Aminobacter]|uniref:RsmB/NOP family class I SAM-dependent RNA methyltransferase n=1 Tax=unclassified Aminobacter TaxID=2644704 RepID=UPI000463BFBD|nr:MULTISPECIES: RsmB/NOP family class I SAM-dependent RNA methyltransferase [unclassified Aminobacter]TWH34981.1 16S rRNA (cytosine967-C5)-methyltransferase [Aminobacter sp. J15]